MLSAYRHYPQSDRTYQQLKPKQFYVAKSTMHTREENVNLHDEADNVDLVSVNDMKPCSPGGVVVAPNNSDKENSLEGMSTIVDGFQQASPV